MAKVTIGGEDFVLGALTFAALKQAWPLIQKNQQIAKLQEAEGAEAIDPIEAMETAIGIIACGLRGTNPELTAEAIGEKITAAECQRLDIAIVDIMIESGFMQRPEPPSGEATPALGEDAQLEPSSTETSTAS